MYRSLLLALALVGTTSVPLQAQTTAWPGPGDRVRIESEEVSGEFSVVEVQPESLVVRAGPGEEPFTVPMANGVGVHGGLLLGCWSAVELAARSDI